MAKHNRSKSTRVFVNRGIKSQKVRCIDQHNNNIGIVETYKALTMAEDAGLDLVQVSKYGDPVPTCKIIDYGKYKYDLAKKQKDNAKKQRESVVKVKEIKFRPSTDVHDLKTKAKLAAQFIDDGCQVKIAIQFKGRELAHKEVAEFKFNEFFDLIGDSACVLNEPKMNGRTMVALLAPSKNRNVVVASM